MTLENVSKLAVLGGGKMGSTLIRAVLDAELLEPGQIAVTTLHPATLERFEEIPGLQTGTDNAAAVDGADVVLLCVKPQKTAEVLESVRAALAPGRLLVSIAAGATTEMLERHVQEGVAVVRAMPNTPSLVGAGMTAICGGSKATREHQEQARTIFGAMGRTLLIDESSFDAVTGLSASGPAFVYTITKRCLAAAATAPDAAVGESLSPESAVAVELAAAACVGAAKMVLETGGHPALLKDDVTTPAGCTVDGILELEAGGLRVTLIKAVIEAKRRAGELVD